LSHSDKLSFGKFRYPDFKSLIDFHFFHFNMRYKKCRHSAKGILMLHIPFLSNYSFSHSDKQPYENEIMSSLLEQYLAISTTINALWLTSNKFSLYPSHPD
jgi:hypothetical protein